MEATTDLEVKLRIAACLSGVSRTAAYCAPYLQRFFRGHQVDYFVHAWPDDVSHLPLYHPKSVSHAVPGDLASKEQRIIETCHDYSHISRIPMYWGISQAIRLVPKHGYDLIVRIRPDMVPLQRLNFSLSAFNPGAIYFSYQMEQPVHAWRPPSYFVSVADKNIVGFHDGLFFGSPDIMRHFETSYDLIDSFCESGMGLRFRPAVYLHYLIAMGITQPLRAPISYHLIDEVHAQKALSLYEFRERQEGRRARDELEAKKHRHIVGSIGLQPRPLSISEDFFESGWLGASPGSNSPTPPATARRLSARRRQKAS